MLFPTQNNTDIGWIWDPFTAEYSKEYVHQLLTEKARKEKARHALSLMISLATSL